MRTLPIVLGVLIIGVLVIQIVRRPAPLPPPANLAAVTAGFNAFQAGDEAGLQKQIAVLGAGLPADQTSGVYVACSPDGYAMRRRARAKQQLDILDKGGAGSMGEAKRYVYFQQLVTGGGGAGFSSGYVGGPTDFECERDPDYAQSHRLDDQQFFAIRDAGRDQVRGWYTGLRQSLGAEFAPHMNEMAHELRVANLRENDQYQDPFPITNTPRVAAQP